jgi:hypothetical protein
MELEMLLWEVVTAVSIKLGISAFTAILIQRIPVVYSSC